jgi:hypothetical protein
MRYGTTKIVTTRASGRARSTTGPSAASTSRTYSNLPLNHWLQGARFRGIVLFLPITERQWLPDPRPAA